MITPQSTQNIKYSQKITRGGALLPEMRALLQAWQPDESAPVFAKRVLRDDIISKATARTVKDYVGAFTRRFLTPTDAPARHLRSIIAGTTSTQLFSDLVFFYTAQEDDLLREFTVLRYWPAVRDGRLAISNQDVSQFIWEAEQDGRIPEPWSADVHRDLPARVLNALSDFGLLDRIKAGRREVLSYRPVDETIVYVAHLLHVGGVTDASLADNTAWAIFGLEPRDVWHRLENAAAAGWFVLQRAGEVVRITWQYQTAEEAIDVLAGR